jgi:glycerol kinase
MNTGARAIRSRGTLPPTVARRIGDGPGEYALDGAIFVSGAAVRSLRDGLGIIENAADTDELARSPPTRGSVSSRHRRPQARRTGTPTPAACSPASRAVRAPSTSPGPSSKARAIRRRPSSTRRWRTAASPCGSCAPTAGPRVVEATAPAAAHLAGLAVGCRADGDAIDANWKPAHRDGPRMSGHRRREVHRRWTKAVERAKGWELDPIA